MKLLQYAIVATALLLTSATTGQSGSTVFVLPANDVYTLLVGNTVDITMAEASRQTGENERYVAYFSPSGLVQTSKENGSVSNYSYTIKDDGGFCWKNTMRRKGGVPCGYFYRAAPKVYELYTTRGAEVVDGKVISHRKANLLLTVTDPRKGNDFQ